MSDDPKNWSGFDPRGLRARLVEVKALLEQAAAVAAAQDAAKLADVAELAQQQRTPRGNRRRRRYR